MHFGATLRFLRIDAGVSLRELARRVGVSSAYLSRVENGHDAAPTPDRLLAIADALGLSRPVLLQLAGQAGPAVRGYLHRVPAASSLLLEIARRNLTGAEVSRVRAFLDREFPDRDRRRPAPLLADLLPPSQVVLGLVCDDLEDLVAAAVAHLPEVRGATRPDLVRRVLARERESPSALGGGVLVPHAVVEGARPAAVLLLLARPLADPAVATPDGKPIRAAVLVVSAEPGPPHLDVLARVARLAAHDLWDDLAAASDPEAATRLLRDIESTW